METQDQRKIVLSESPSVHFCSKCGWPFPKPHPSAKNRRAHKRICGTIEGYKLIDSGGENLNLGVSDNGSDEDPKNPCQKFEKRSSEEISGGVGGRSNRSEDEVFSDAVTEFSDSWSSPVHEDTLKGAVVSDKKVGSFVEYALETDQQTQVVVSAGNLPLPNCPTDSSQAHEAEALETDRKSLSSSVPTEDIVSKCNSELVDSSNNTAEDLPLGISDVDGSASSPILAGSPKEVGIKNVLEQETLSSTVLEQQTSVKEKEENGRDEVLSDVVVTPTKTSSATFELSSVGLETDSETSVNVNNDRIEEFKKDQNHEDSNLRKDSGYTDQTEADSPQDGDVLSTGISIDDCNTEGEKDENFHVLSVVDGIPLGDHAEIMIEGFKDHTSVKSNFPVTLNVSEEIEHVGDANKDTINDGNSFSFHPRKPDESIAISSTGSPFLEGDLKQNGGSTDTSDLNINNGDLRLSYAEAQTTSKKSHPESCKKDPETEEVYIGGLECLEEVKVARNISTAVTESVSDLSVPYADQSITLLAVGNSEHSKNDGLELSDATDTGTTPGLVSNVTLVSAHVSEPDVTSDDGLINLKKEFQESTTPFLEDTSEGGLDASSFGNTAVSHPSQENMLHEDSQEAMKESRVNSTNEVLAESAATVSECPTSNHNVGAEVIQQTIETSQEPISEVDSARQSSSEADNGHCTDGIEGASGIGIKQLQEERDENLTNQPIKAPVMDASVDSSSQSDSLECNWGSISAFSTQSDVQSATDTETVRPTTSEVPLQPESINLQKTDSSWKEEDHHASAETEAFEAPSFMTLVEPQNKVDAEAPCDPQAVQSAPSKDFQAAWFPSITNVVNDSQGRKKNEEIIAKVTNWSTGTNQQHHAPLKSPLVEANPEKTKPKSPKKVENARKENNAPVLTVNSILGPEAAGTEEDSKREIGKEWNSPARYPSEIKKEKKKNKGRPYWVPFVCCSSVN